MHIYIPKQSLDGFPLLHGRAIAFQVRFQLPELTEIGWQTFQQRKESLLLILLLKHFPLSSSDLTDIEIGIVTQHVLSFLRDHELFEKRTQKLRAVDQRVVHGIADRGKRKVVHDRFALRIRQSTRPTVANPDMDASTTGVDKEDVFEPELVLQDVFQNHHGVRHELPALGTDGGALAAMADLGGHGREFVRESSRPYRYRKSVRAPAA